MKTSSFILLGILALTSCSRSVEKTGSSFEEKKESVLPERINVEINTSNDDELLSLESRRNRDYQFEQLLDDRINFTSRILAAKAYFASFDYQIRHDIIKSSTLEILYFEATNEFSHRLPEVYEHINPKKISPFKNRNKSGLSFYALAAALDESNLSVSFYDLVKKSLLKEKAGKTLLRHEEPLVIGESKTQTIALLNARVDIYAFLAYDSLVKKKEKSLGNRLKAFTVIGNLFGSNEEEVSPDLNEATLKMAKEYLSKAVATKNFLVELGLKKDLEKKLRNSLKKIKFNQTSDLDESHQEIQRLIIRLLEI